LLIPPAASQEDKAVYLQEASTRLNVGRVSTVEDRLAEIALAFPATWSLKPADPQGIVRHARAVYAVAWVLCSVVMLGLGALVAGAAIAERVSQDEQRIALLRALGSSEGMLFGDYVQQSAILGIMGALLGLLGSRALCAMLNEMGSAQSVELLLTARLGAAAFFVVVLAAMVGAVAPTSRAVRRNATWTLYGDRSEVASVGNQHASLSMTGVLTHGGSEA
jgi:predicted lysophospholipase L1 biosynthesis ABC-type transport system permease subunit